MERVNTAVLDEALVCTILVTSAAILHEEESKKRKKRSKSVRDFLQQRNMYGAHSVTVNVLREKDPYSFRRYLRMSSDVYEVKFVFFGRITRRLKLIDRLKDAQCKKL